MKIFDHSKFGITKACSHSNFLFTRNMDDELFRLRNHSNFISSYVIGPSNALIPSKQIPKRFTMRLAKPYQKDFRVVMVILKFFPTKNYFIFVKMASKLFECHPDTIIAWFFCARRCNLP